MTQLNKEDAGRRQVISLMAPYVGEDQTPDGVIGGDFDATATAAVTLTGAGHVETRMDDEKFYFPFSTAITLEDSGNLADGDYGAWRVEMDKLGAFTALDTGAAMTHSSAEDALLSLAGRALTADAWTVGILVIGTTGAAFDIGTTNLNAGTVSTFTFYPVRGPRTQVSGLTAALGASLVSVDGAATYGIGTIDARVNGINVAQIAALAAQTMDDADVISTLKAGGWLLVTDLAGTGIYMLAADGAAGSVSTMAYASVAAADVALDTLITQLPELFCAVARMTVDNQTVGDFTAGTTFWDATSVTTVEADEDVGDAVVSNQTFDSFQPGQKFDILSIQHFCEDVAGTPNYQVLVGTTAACAATTPATDVRGGPDVIAKTGETHGSATDVLNLNATATGDGAMENLKVQVTIRNFPRPS